MSKLIIKLPFVPVVVAVTSLLASCGAKKIPMQSFYSASNCAISEQTIRRIETREQLDGLLSPQPFFSTGNQTSETPPIDFEHEQLILVAMGMKSTAGYRIDWSNDPATLENGDLYLPVALHHPPSNQIQAQVMTSPCQIFSLPKTEYREVKLRDIDNGSRN